jgi:ligand-binding SRPBCC domain-containing protein
MSSSIHLTKPEGGIRERGPEDDAKVRPISLDWVAEHTEHELDRLFADRQIQRPFTYWYHRHLFLDDGQGGTILRDEVDFRPPQGTPGEFFGSEIRGVEVKADVRL